MKELSDAYSRKFYDEELKSSAVAARAIVPVLLSLVPAKSVLDVGCGAGAFLREFQKHGLSSIFGIDSEYVPIDFLLIDPSDFRAADLSRPLDLKRRFDIVLCLEVAEHIDVHFGAVLVESLCRHGDVVIFSAAIPGQGGTHHVNEQFASYWAKQFEANGYTNIDALRPLIWNDVSIDYWYRQNIIIFANSQGLADNPALAAAQLSRPSPIVDMVHPVGYIDKVDTLNSLRNWEKEAGEELISLRSQVHTLKEAENSLLRDISVLRDAESRFLRDITTLRVSLAESEGRHQATSQLLRDREADLKTTVARLETETSTALAARDQALTVEVPALRSQIDGLKEKENALLHDISILRAAESDFLRDIMALRVAAAEAETQSREVATLRSQIDGFKERENALLHDILVLRTAESDFLRDIMTLRGVAAEAERQSRDVPELRSQIDGFREREDALLHEISVFRAAESDYLRDIMTLRSTAAAAETELREVPELRSEIDVLKEQEIALLREISVLRTAESDYLREIMALRGAAAETEAQLRDALADAVAQHSLHKEREEQLRADLARLGVEQRRLADDWGAAAEMMNASERKAEMLSETISVLKREVSELTALADERAHELELSLFLSEAHARALEDVTARGRSLIRREQRKQQSLSARLDCQPSSRSFRKAIAQTTWRLMEIIKPASTSSQRGDIKQIVYVNGCPEGESKRYRIENIADSFRRYGVKCEVFLIDQLDEALEQLPKADLLVIFRARYSPELAEIILEANDLGCPVVFDVDDLVFEVESVEFIGAVQGLSSEAKAFHVDEVRRFRRTLDMCDVAFCTTAYLAKRLADTGITALVVPNTINPAQKEIGHSVARAERKRDEITRIGYFSGSATHNKDFLAASEAIEIVLKGNENVEFHLVGELEIDESFSAIRCRVFRHSFMPYLKMLEFMARMDFVIAPLELNNPFSQGKSELKIFEAAVVGVPCVASATEAYKAVITHRRNGMLCETPDDWLEALTLLISEYDARRAMGRRARDEIVPMFDIDQQAAAIAKTYRLARKIALDTEHSQRLEQIRVIRSSGMFDTTWYLNQYQDVKDAKVNPIVHYIEHGAAELRNPGPAFDTAYYLTSNRDVADAGINPLLHYILNGRREGRKPFRTSVTISSARLPEIVGTSADRPGEANISVSSVSFDRFHEYDLAIVHRGNVQQLPRRLVHLHQGISALGFRCALLNAGELPAAVACGLRVETVLFNGAGAIARELVDTFLEYAPRNQIDIALDLSGEVLPSNRDDIALPILMRQAAFIVVPSKSIVRDDIQGAGLLVELPPSLYDEPLAHFHDVASTELLLAVTGVADEEDLDEWRSSLATLLVREPNLRIRFFTSSTLGDIYGDGRVEYIDVDEYGVSAHLRSCQVNLIISTSRTDSIDGCDFTFWLEAAAQGIPTIALCNNAVAIQIEHHVDGILANSREKAVELVAQLLHGSELRRNLGIAARAKAKRCNGVNTVAAAFAKSIGLTCVRATEAKVLAEGRLHIAWVIPDLIIGGGGHRNILRAAFFLNSFGHRISLYFTDTKSTARTLKANVRQHFYDFDCDVHVFDGSIEPADVVLATHWTTVGPALTAKGNCLEIIYFVQDYEPIFTSMGSDYIRAENTYRKGLYCITSGAWCEEFLKRDFNAEADHFRFPVDRSVYYPRIVGPQTKVRIVFFAKPEMPRRCFELGLLALREVNKLRPDVELIFFGSEHAAELSYDFPVEVLSLVPTLDDLAKLYSAATIGLVFSTSNPSLIPFEMMACGLPVVDLDRGDNAVNYNNRRDIAFLADPEPELMARQIVALLSDVAELQLRRANGLAFVNEFPSELEMAQRIESLILKRLSRSEASEGALRLRAKSRQFQAT